MDKKDLIKIIKEETKKHFSSHSYSLKDEMLITNEILIGELLNPNNSLPYTEEHKGYYTYMDPGGVNFFVRAHYVPEPDNFFEFKTGWVDEKGKPHYEPSIPYGNKNTSTMDIHSRSDTVAKIFRDEIIPFFNNQTLTNLMVIKPLSTGRMKFAERLVRKFIPKEGIEVEYGSPIIISKK